MKLNERLAEIRARSRQSLSDEERRAVDDAIERQRMLQLPEHAPAVGEFFPDFALPDPTGRIVASDRLLAAGPVVLAFFRGGWCPYCAATMEALEAIRTGVEAAGATLVGVTLDRPEVLAQTLATGQLGFPLLSDADGRLARLCGVHYEMSEPHQAIYRRRGLDLAELHAGAGWELPMPAMYVLAPDGRVAFAFADPDYTRRAEPADLLRALEAVQAAGS